MVKVHVTYQCETCGQRYPDRAPASFCESGHRMAEAAQEVAKRISDAMTRSDIFRAALSGDAEGGV